MSVEEHPAKAAVIARLAADIRLRLLLHQEQGLDYPLTPELRDILRRPVRRGKEAKIQEGTKNRLQPVAAGKTASENKTDADLLPWSALQKEIRACARCPLSATARGRVLGKGAERAELLLVGDYSVQTGDCAQDVLFGLEEDELLWKMLHAIGQSPGQVYVTNVLKCCPAVEARELVSQECAVFLRNEITLVQPKIICAMGDVAASALLARRDSLSRLRGHFFPYEYSGNSRTARALVSYHPRFLLKHEHLKKAAWQDLQKIRDALLRD